MSVGNDMLVFNGGDLTFTDKTSIGYGPPSTDASQDWVEVDRSVTTFFIRFKVERDMDPDDVDDFVFQYDT